jgi:hypothetical protein
MATYHANGSNECNLGKTNTLGPTTNAHGKLDTLATTHPIEAIH